MPIGVVVRRLPGISRWQKYSWKAVAVLPGAEATDWHEMRKEGEAVEFHAASPQLELYATDTEAYLHGLASETPSIYVVMRPTEDLEKPLEVLLVTASPYEAQDYDDSGEEIIEKVPMPPGLLAWIEQFVETHHKEEAFKKRRRDKLDFDKSEEGVGDARIPQLTDVYRAPARARKQRLN